MLTLKMYLLSIGGPHSNACVMLGGAQSNLQMTKKCFPCLENRFVFFPPDTNLVHSSCSPEVGCISLR